MEIDELVNEVCAGGAIEKEKVRGVIEHYFEKIRYYLLESGRFPIPGLGTFYLLNTQNDSCKNSSQFVISFVPEESLTMTNSVNPDCSGENENLAGTAVLKTAFSEKNSECAEVETEITHRAGRIIDTAITDVPKPQHVLNENTNVPYSKIRTIHFKKYLTLVAAFAVVCVLAIIIIVKSGTSENRNKTVAAGNNTGGIDTQHESPHSAAVSEGSEQSKFIIFSWGDSLEKIAEREYGSKIFWPYIYYENEKTITAPEKIVPVQDRIILRYSTNRDLGELYFDLYRYYKTKSGQNVKLTTMKNEMLRSAFYLNRAYVMQNYQNLTDQEKLLLR